MLTCALCGSLLPESALVELRRTFQHGLRWMITSWRESRLLPERCTACSSSRTRSRRPPRRRTSSETAFDRRAPGTPAYGAEHEKGTVRAIPSHWRIAVRRRERPSAGRLLRESSQEQTPE